MNQSAGTYYDTFEAHVHESHALWARLGTTPASFMQRWAEGWNLRDPDILASVVTEDFIYEDPSLWGAVLHGREAFRAFAKLTLLAFPDNEFDVTDAPLLSLDGTRIVQPWQARGHFLGPLHWSVGGKKRRPFAPTGKPYRFRGMDAYELRGDKACRGVSHYNALEVMQQIGLFPGPESWLSRLFPSVAGVLAPLQRRGRADH